MPEKKTFSQKLMESWVLQAIGIGLAISAGLGVLIAVFWRILTEPGTPPGADPTSFAHTSKVMVDYFRATGHFPPVDLSWYAGFEHIAVPPLINVIIGTIYYFTHNIQLSVRLFQPLAEGLFFLSMFYLVKKEGYPTINALIAGLAFAFMPTIFNTYGSSTKMVALFLLPIAFYLTNLVLTKIEIKYMAYLAVIEGLIILAHPMTGVVFAIFLIGYAILYAILDRQIVTRRFFFVMFGLFCGFLLAGFYVVPFFIEKVSRTAIALEEATILNVTFNVIYIDFISQVGGVIFLLLPLYVIWRDKSPKLSALYIMGLFSALIFFGYYFGFGHFFPFSLSYGYIWFFMTGFSFAYLLGLIIPWKKFKNIGIYFLRVVLGLSFIVFYIYSANHFISFENLKNTKNTALESDFKVAEKIESIPNDGRLLTSHYPFGMFNWVLFLASNKASVEGHYFGIAKVGKKIAVVADAIHNDYPQYVYYKIKDLNVRFFLANSILNGLEDANKKNLGQEVTKTLTENDYKLIYRSSEKDSNEIDLYQLYFQDKPSTYIMPVDQKVLVIGQYNSTFAAAVSPAKIDVLEGGSVYLDDYPADFLKHFETVVLYGFSYRNKAKAEQIARDYTNQGGNLVIDLFNMGISPLASSPNFLGVEGNSYKINQEVKIETSGDEPLQKLIPRSFNLPSEIFDMGNGKLDYRPMKEWNSVEYVGLDESLAIVPDDADTFSVLGYKNIDKSKVTYVGLNFFYHLYLSHDKNELEMVKNLIQNPNVSKDEIDNTNKPILTQKEWTPEKSRFEISAEKEQLLMISLTHSPHWKAKLDGKSIPIIEAESLMVVEVPAGNHTLELNYEPTKNSILGWVVTGGTGLFLVLMIIFYIIKNKRESKKTS